ncbi:MAG TPA: metallophosphoesterase [Acidisarcina sp.]
MVQRDIRLVTMALMLSALLSTLLFAPGAKAQEDAAACDEADAQTVISAPGPTFTVADHDIPKHWSLIAYGDMRFTDPMNQAVTNPKVRKWLVDRIAEEKPDMLLLSGDVPYNGSVTNDYAVYQSESEPWRTAGLHVFPAMGNHELQKTEVQNPENWWGAFPQLKGRRWYSVKFGKMYIITIDSNLCLGPGSRQQAWIADQLDHIPKGTKFVFVSLHHPPVADPVPNDPSHSGRPNEHALAMLLASKAPSIDANIVVIAGHVHNYQRFYQDGIVYLVSGGGGAKPKQVSRTPANLYQDPAFPNYHYLKFIFDGKRLNATMYRIADPTATTFQTEVKDTFIVDEKKH